MHQLCRACVFAKRIAARHTQIGQPLVLKQQKQESLTCFIRFYLTVFFYLTDNTGLGIFAYLCVQIIIPFTLIFSGTLKILGRFHPERYYLSELSGNILSDFMIGNTPGGLLKLAGLIAVYMGGAILAAALVFKRKELDF